MTKGITIEEAKQQLHDKVVKAMTESMMIVEADAKLNAGVETGTLRRSITHEVKDEGSKITGGVGTNVEYGFFHSLDNPYLENAVDSNLENIRQKIKDVVSGD